jgi:hypothetical protein
MKFQVENLMERNNGDLGVDGRILKFILKKQDFRMFTGFIWLMISPRGGLFEHGNESSGSIKCGCVLSHMRRM